MRDAGRDSNRAGAWGSRGPRWLSGANLRLVAWELSVEERRVGDGWEQAVNEGLVKVAGRDPVNDEELWRLTPGGRSVLAAAREPR